MNRDDFQQLADVRIAEAAVLLAQGNYDGAYYLAGYAVECGLKACDQAEQLIAAITDAAHGVLPWIKQRW
jgi:HEPN domain-containing protein